MSGGDEVAVSTSKKPSQVERGVRVIEEARRSLAWALQVPPESLPLPKIDEVATRPTAWIDLFRYPRSLLVSWLTNLGMQTTG